VKKLVGSSSASRARHTEEAPKNLAGWDWEADFFFKPFSRKIFINTSLVVSFQKIDPDLGTITIGTEVTCLGAMVIGAEV
jgi:hypothetical protein